MPVWKFSGLELLTAREDSKLDLTCVAKSQGDYLPLWLSASEPRDKYDIDTQVEALGLSRDANVPLFLTAANHYLIDCGMQLSAASPRIRLDIPLNLEATDGTVRKDICLRLRVVPHFTRNSSHSYHRLSSVCKEV